MNIDMEIRKISKTKDNFLRTNIAFNTSEFGTIVLKGFRVGRSPKYEGIWVQPPCFSVFGKYYKMCFFENNDTWKAVEAFLIDVFEKYEEEHPEEFIDLDKISSEIGGDAYR